MEGEEINVKIKMFDVVGKKENVLDMEKYVEGAVAFAMPAEFPLEALKAQAVCSRTIAVRRMTVFGGSGCRRHPGFEVCTDPEHCQGFLDEEERRILWGARFEEYSSKVKEAVMDTAGIILTYNGKPIEAVYHRACGGSTEDSENVWGNSVSYLRRVECDYCKNSAEWRTVRTFSEKQLKNKLGIALDEARFDKSRVPGIIDNVQSTKSGRIRKIKIGDMVFDGADVKRLLGFNSTKISWKISAITFEVMGKGHGLGMCQHGARTMALMGFPLDEILKFYFTGVELSELKAPTVAKPLFGKIIAIDPGRGGDANHCGPMGLSEGYVNLEIARSLESLLKKEGARVVMTRDKNEYKSLHERARVINDSNADIAVIIHQNCWEDEKSGGTELFYLPGDEKGRRLSLCIHKELISELKLKDLGVKEADLYLLRETRIPSTLINVACLSNPEEERLLSEREFRERAAYAILTGIIAYYQGHFS